MSDLKITQLPEIVTPASNDVFPIVNIATDTTSKVQFSNITALFATAGANSNITSLSGLTTPLSVPQGGTGLATITSGSVLIGNGTGAIALLATTGSGNIVRATSATLTTPTITSATLITPSLGVATATSINGVTITSSTGVLTLTNGKTLTVTDSTTLATNSITLAGGEVITFSATNALSLLTGGTSVMTFPTATDTVAVLGTAQTYTATQTEKQVIWTVNAITATANAATVPITHRLHNVTNSSAATLTITMTTTSAVDGALSEIRIFDFSGVAQTLVFVNTENSTVVVPTTSNGSTTLPLSVLFQFNGATSKWRCMASS